MPIRRYDAATVQKSVKTDAGFLKAPARLTRVGVFDYQEPGGKVRRELRLPEEVFSADSLDSFQLVPLTNNHPSIDDGKVTSKNAGLLQVGTVGQDVARDGSFVAATVLVTDAKAIEQIESGRSSFRAGTSAIWNPRPVCGKTTPALLTHMTPSKETFEAITLRLWRWAAPVKRFDCC